MDNNMSLQLRDGNVLGENEDFRSDESGRGKVETFPEPLNAAPSF